MTLCPNGWSKTVDPRRFDSAAAAQASNVATNETLHELAAISRSIPDYTGLCGTITLQILFMSRNADEAVSRPGASQISEQLVREVDKQTEQHNSRDDRARMMRERLDRLDVYPVAQPMRGASGRMLSHGVARLWDYFECAKEK